ncbi:MAG: putative glutamine amidotransferase [Verrucomicrobiales bacterium]|jgi:putative glutamine amidotransferase
MTNMLRTTLLRKYRDWMQPLIGITGRQFPYGLVDGAPSILAEALIDVVLVDYVDAVLASGGLPMHLPLGVDPKLVIDRLDGLILSGGADVDPAHYGQDPGADIGSVEPVRDAFELDIAARAISASLPTLGICRGHQVLNIAAGGTLSQHRPDHARFDRGVMAEVHGVRLEEGSIPAGAYGPERQVNSLHHQVVDELGSGIRPVGRADDGEIEAIEFTGKPIVGIQWHPEMFRRQDPIFDWLVEAATT